MASRCARIAGLSLQHYDPVQRSGNGEAAMDASRVLEYWQLFGAHGLDVCIDGGWAVDALLGEQTRPHADLDIALPAFQAVTLRALMAARGFRQIPWHDSWLHNFVLRQANGETLDVHSYELEPDGSNLLGVPYTAVQLSGTGTILGTRVRCIPPDVLVGFHTGYPLDEDDWHDVRLLCERFELKIPDDYARFSDGESSGTP